MSVLEIRWGLIPDMTGTQLLPQVVGLDVAKELTFTGRMVEGEEAVRLGLATRVSDTPLDDALALARRDRRQVTPGGAGGQGPPEPGRHRDARRGLPGRGAHDQGLIGSPNQVEAVTAYFEKRAPRFVD